MSQGTTDSGSSAGPMSRLHLLRSVLIGVLMAAVIGFAGPWWTGYRHSYRFTDHHNGGVTFLIVSVGILFNFGIGLFWRRARFSARELLFITAMMFASASISVTGTVAHLIPAIAAPHYLQGAGEAQHFRPTASSEFYREGGGSVLLNPALYPLDPDDAGTAAIKKFWEGIPDQEPVPVGPWLGPVLLWGVMLMAVYAMSVSAMSIIRKQWVDHEHLSYPIAQIPLEVCRALANPRGKDSIFRSKPFWVGFWFVFLGVAVGSICRRVTGQPGFYMGFNRQVIVNLTGGVQHKLEIGLNVIPAGLAFLIPTRVAFSVWVMVLVAWAWNGLCKTYGVGLDVPMGYAGDPSLQYLIMGALIIFVGANLWHSRRHLQQVFRCALGLGAGGYDREEPSSYRTMLVTLAAAVALAIVWLYYAGVPPLYGAFYLVAMFVIFYGIARVIAQCGLPLAGTPLTPEAFTVASIGARNMSARAVTGLYSQVGWHQNMRQVTTVGATQGNYLAGRTRGLFWSMLLAMGVTYAVGCFTVIYMSYRKGGALTMDPWIFPRSSALPWLWSSTNITRQPGPAYAGFAWGGAGAAIMALIIIAQRTFFWWPLHPVGIIMSTPHLVRVTWFSIAVTWLAKLGILKFGGHRAYRRARQVAIGMVLGMFTATGFWSVVDLLADALG